jgi:hypothetical protein
MNKLIAFKDKTYMLPLNGNNCYTLLNSKEKEIDSILISKFFNFRILSFCFSFDTTNFNTRQTVYYYVQDGGDEIIYKDTDNILKYKDRASVTRITNIMTIEPMKLYNVLIYMEGNYIVLSINNNITMYINRVANNNLLLIKPFNVNFLTPIQNLTTFPVLSLGATLSRTNIFDEIGTSITSRNTSAVLLAQSNNMRGFIGNIHVMMLNSDRIDRIKLSTLNKNIYNNGVPKIIKNLSSYGLNKLQLDFINDSNINDLSPQKFDILNVTSDRGTLTYNAYNRRYKYFSLLNNKIIPERPQYFYEKRDDIRISDYIFPEMSTIIINNLTTGSTINNYGIKNYDGNNILSNNINNMLINNSNIFDSAISGSVYNFIIRNTPVTNPQWKLDYTFIPSENNRFSPNFLFNGARLSEFNFNHTNLGQLNIQYLSLSNNNFAATSKTTLKTLFHDKNNITFDNLYINNPTGNTSAIRFDENSGGTYSINTLNANLSNNLRNSTGTYSFTYNHLTPINNNAFTVNFSANCTNFYWENNNVSKIEGMGNVDFNFTFTPVTQKQLSIFNVNNSNIRKLTLTSSRTGSTLINNSATNGFNLSNNKFNTGYTEFFNNLSLNNFSGLDQINVSNSELYGSFDWNSYTIRQRFGNFNNANSVLNFGLNKFNRFISLPSARTLNFTTTNNYTIDFLNNDVLNFLKIRLEESQLDGRKYTGQTLSFINNNPISGSCTFLNVDDNEVKERITFSSNVNNLSINNPDSRGYDVFTITGYTYQLEFSGASLLNLSTLDLSPKQVGPGSSGSAIYNTSYFNGDLIFNNSIYSTTYNINTSSVGYNEYLLSGGTYYQNIAGLVIPQVATGNSVNFVGTTSIRLNNLTGTTTLILNSSNSNLTGITFQTAGTCTITSFDISNTPILNLNIPSNNRITGTFNAVNLPYINSNTGYTYPLGNIIQSLTINIGSTQQNSSFLFNDSTPRIQNFFSGNSYFLSTQMEPITVLNQLEKIYNNGVAYTGTGWQFGTSTVQTSVKTLNINTFKITNKALSSIPSGFTFNGSDGTFTTPNSPANILTRIGELRYVLTTQRASGGTSTNLRYRWFINL